MAKWVRFCHHFFELGDKVTYYDAVTTVSKYVTVCRGGKKFTVRFSNHKPISSVEAAADTCDFFVGASHLNDKWLTWEDAIEAACKHFE